MGFFYGSGGSTTPGGGGVAYHPPSPYYEPSPQAGGGSSSDFPQGPPQQVSVPYSIATQSLAFAAKAPGYTYERPIAAANQLTGGLVGDIQHTIGSIPGVGAALGGVGNVFSWLSGLAPSAVNSGTAIGLRDTANLPDTTPVVRESSGWHVLPAGMEGKGPFTTLGTLRAEAQQRGFTPQDVTDLQNGKDPLAFGDRRMMTDPIVDLAGRVIADPTNILLGAGIAGQLSKLPRLTQAIRGSEEIAKVVDLSKPALNVLDGAAAVRAGSSAGVTLGGLTQALQTIGRGTSEFGAAFRKVPVGALEHLGVKGIASGTEATSLAGTLGSAIPRAARVYRTTAVGTTVGQLGVQAADRALPDNSPIRAPFERVFQFADAMSHDTPLSNSMLWDMYSAFNFPIRDVAGAVTSKAKRAWYDKVTAPFIVPRLVDAWNPGTRATAAARQAEVISWFGGQDSFTDFLGHLYGRAVQTLQPLGALADRPVKTLPEAMGHIANVQKIVQGMSHFAGKEGLVGWEKLAQEARDWDMHGGSVTGLTGGVSWPTFDPKRMAGTWTHWQPLVAKLSGIYGDASPVVVGIMDGLLPKEHLAGARVLFDAAAKDGMVSPEDARVILSKYPSLYSKKYDTDSLFSRLIVKDAVPVNVKWIRQRLKKLEKNAPTMQEYLHPVQQWEERAPQLLQQRHSVLDPNGQYDSARVPTMGGATINAATRRNTAASNVGLPAAGLDHVRELRGTTGVRSIEDNLTLALDKAGYSHSTVTQTVVESGGALEPGLNVFLDAEHADPASSVQIAAQMLKATGKGDKAADTATVLYTGDEVLARYALQPNGVAYRFDIGQMTAEQGQAIAEVMARLGGHANLNDTTGTFQVAYREGEYTPAAEAAMNELAANIGVDPTRDKAWIQVVGHDIPKGTPRAGRLKDLAPDVTVAELERVAGSDARYIAASRFLAERPHIPVSDFVATRPGSAARGEQVRAAGEGQTVRSSVGQQPAESVTPVVPADALPVEPPRSRAVVDAAPIQTEFGPVTRPPQYAPGEAPLEPGMVRAYHYTGSVDSLNSIRQNGLQRVHAKGETYGEPNQIWFSATKPNNDKPFVEVHLKPSEITGSGSPPQHILNDPQALAAWADHVNGIGANFATVLDSIPADRIVSFQEPWMHHYDYMAKQYDPLHPETWVAPKGEDPLVYVPNFIRQAGEISGGEYGPAAGLWLHEYQSARPVPTAEDIAARPVAEVVADPNIPNAQKIDKAVWSPLYHGSSRPVTEFVPGGGSEPAGQLFGPGVYATDNRNVAQTYETKDAIGAAREGSLAPTTVGVRWKGANPPRIINGDSTLLTDAGLGHLPDMVKRGIADNLNYRGIRWSRGGAPKTLRELFQWVDKKLSSMGEYATRDDANAIYEIINNEVGQKFDAIQHEGGALTGSETHNAYVFLDPKMVEPTAPGASFLATLQHDNQGQVLYLAARDAETGDLIPRFEPEVEHTLPPDELAKIADLVREIRLMHPTYTVKVTPNGGTPYYLGQGKAIMDQVLARQALGDSLKYSVWSKTNQAWGFLFGKVTSRGLNAGMKQALYNELLPKGATVSEVNRFLFDLENTARHDYLFGKMRRARRGDMLPEATINEIARGEHPGAQTRLSNPEGTMSVKVSRGFSQKVIDAVGPDGFSTALYRSGSRVFRNLETVSGGKGQLGRLIDEWYGKTPSKSTTATVGAGFMHAEHFLSSWYHLFRFMLDPRWHAMNYLEADILGGAKYGMEATRFTGAKTAPMDNASRLHSGGKIKAETALSHDEYASGWLDGRNLEGYIGRGFRVARVRSTRDVLRTMASEDPSIVALRAKFGGNPDEWVKGLEDMMYRYDTVGVRETIMDEAKTRFTNEEYTAMEPLITQLYRRNQKIYEDVVHTFHGNVNRSNMERLANSYFLYWPISYQLKAAKWLFDVLTKEAGGYKTNLAGAVALNHLVEMHQNRYAHDQAYRDMFDANPDIWRTAAMLLPITPFDLGVSLSKLTSYSTSALAATLGLGKYPGGYPQDPIQAGLNMVKLGPLYSWDLANRFKTEALQPDQAGAANRRRASGSFPPPVTPFP